MHDAHKLRTIPELAKMVGMKEWTMRRLLVAAHERIREDSGVDLLEKSTKGAKGKWRTTLATLRKHLPAMFNEDMPTREEVERLREDLNATNRKVNALAAHHREFQKKAYDWFKKGGRS